MAIALLSHTGKGNAASSSTTAIDTSSGGGASLIVVTVTDYTGQDPAVITDSVGNSFTSLTTRSIGLTRQRTMYKLAPTNSATYQVNVDGTNGFVCVCVAAFTGVDTSGFDQDTGNTATGTSSIQPNSITPFGNDELFVTGVGDNVSSGTLSINSSFSITDQANYSPFFVTAIGYKVQTTGGAENPTWSIGTNGDFAVQMATFKAAGAGGSAIKTINGLALASVKTVNGLAIANMKSWNGLQ